MHINKSDMCVCVCVPMNKYACNGMFCMHTMLNVVAICFSALTHSLFCAIENTDKWGNCRYDDDDDDVYNSLFFCHFPPPLQHSIKCMFSLLAQQKKTML